MIGLLVTAHLMFFGPVDFVSYNCVKRVCRPVFWDGSALCRDRSVVRKRSVVISNDVCREFGVRW